MGVMIDCLDFSIPGLFAMATTAAGKSPNSTPTKWNKRLQKPMGNFTSLVHMMAKLLSVCKRTKDCKVSEIAHVEITAVIVQFLLSLFLHAVLVHLF